MAAEADRHALSRAIGRATRRENVELEPLDTDSVSHGHYRIARTGTIARVPRFSQWGAAPADHLAYQAAAFARAAPSGHTPRLEALVPASDDFATGALIVEEIDGAPPELTGPKAASDMAAIALALAALHELDVPPAEARAPLQFHDDAVAATLGVIEAQAVFIADAAIAPEAARALSEELAWARKFAADTAGDPAPLCLVGTDTHPGNFLIDGDGKAWFVDLEKLVYGNPAIDLAHATLATSTGWERRSAAVLSRKIVSGFYAHYLGLLSPGAAAEIDPWLAPMRRLTWLRTMTWFARWRTDWSRHPGSAVSEKRLNDHIEAHIARSFDPATIAKSRAEWLGT